MMQDTLPPKCPVCHSSDAPEVYTKPVFSKVPGSWPGKLVSVYHVYLCHCGQRLVSKSKSTPGTSHEFR